MIYAIKTTRVEICYVEADNYDEAINKVRTGDVEFVDTVSNHYEREENKYDNT